MIFAVGLLLAVLPVFLLLVGLLVPLCFILGTKRILGPFIAATVLFFTALELVCYILVRHIVYVSEMVFSKIGFASDRKIRQQLDRCQNYSEYQKVARKLDIAEGREDWKFLDKSSTFDWRWVRETKIQLHRSRIDSNYTQLGLILKKCLRKNVGGILKEELFSQTRQGTKKLVVDFVDEIRLCLQFLAEAPEKSVSTEEKVFFFEAAERTLGQNALCLSGGAGMGKYHYGVVRALLESNTLPQIICGTSAGAVVASLVGTRKDHELRNLLRKDIRELQTHVNSFNESYLTIGMRLLKTGACYDERDWLAKIRWHCNGDMTFLEAYRWTGRILNITVTSHGEDTARILNYLTTPNVTVASAVLASAAVPGFIKGARLMERDSRGSLRPYHVSSKLVDGSLTGDIPLAVLSEMFNVHFFIVSQTNPHIIPFFFNNRGEGGTPSVWRKRTGGWRGGFLLSTLELYLKLDMKNNLKWLGSLDLLPNVFGYDWRYLWIQDGDFQGHCTIVPRAKLRDYFKLISDPTYADLVCAVKEGEARTWNKLSMLNCRLSVTNEVRACLERAERNGAGEDTSGSVPSRENAFTQALSFAFPSEHRTLKGSRKCLSR